MVRKGLRQRGKATHLSFICFHQTVTQSPNFGSISNFLGELRPKLHFGPQFPLTSGGYHLPCLLHGVMGRLKRGPTSEGMGGSELGATHPSRRRPSLMAQTQG